MNVHVFHQDRSSFRCELLCGRGQQRRVGSEADTAQVLWQGGSWEGRVLVEAQRCHEYLGLAEFISRKVSVTGFNNTVRHIYRA